MGLLGRAVALSREVGDGDSEIDNIKRDPALQVLSGRQDYHDLIEGTSNGAGRGL